MVNPARGRGRTGIRTVQFGNEEGGKGQSGVDAPQPPGAQRLRRFTSCKPERVAPPHDPSCIRTAKRPEGRAPTRSAAFTPLHFPQASTYTRPQAVPAGLDNKRDEGWTHKGSAIMRRTAAEGVRTCRGIGHCSIASPWPPSRDAPLRDCVQCSGPRVSNEFRRG